jgi:hypothetical protein
MEDGVAGGHPCGATWLQRFVYSLIHGLSKAVVWMLIYHLQVSSDLLRYIDATVKDKANFLVEDPNWAQDFAPNG